MRYRTLFFALLVAAVAGCAGRYDRELLGDAAPEYQPVVQDEAPPVEEDYASGDTTGYEELYNTPPDYDMFGDLGPYGSWYQTDMYGVVWRPIAPVGWGPYVRGHWIYTSYGWMWVSYDPFGWATYHYGTWWLDPVLGWIWIPSYVWSPCPVDWVYWDDYIGWAPQPPPCCTWEDPWNDGGRYKDGWVVVPAGKFKEVDVGQNNVPPARFKDAYRTGTAKFEPPTTRQIERDTRQSFKQTDIRFETQRYGQHELRKVILPERERQIVDRFPMPPVTTPRETLYVPHPVDGGGGSPPPSSVDKGKSKGSSPPPAQETKPAKFKERGNSGKSDSGTSKAKADKKDDNKDNGKSKDDSKDNGKSKDDKKDNGSPSKAKGKKK